MNLDMASVGGEWLPAGELIQDPEGRDLMWVAPADSGNTELWREINSLTGPPGFSAVFLSDSRRNRWWSEMPRCNDQPLADLERIDARAVYEPDGQYFVDRREHLLGTLRSLGQRNQGLAHLEDLFGQMLPAEPTEGSTLARPGSVPVDESSLQGAIHRCSIGADVALVPVGRPADVPCHMSWESLGWQYMTHKLSGYVYASVMLRSWEDRFGARLLTLGQDTMVVVVERRPGNRSDAIGLACELSSFAPESQMAEDSLDDFADYLLDAAVWEFWWDE